MNKFKQAVELAKTYTKNAKEIGCPDTVEPFMVSTALLQAEEMLKEAESFVNDYIAHYQKDNEAKHEWLAKRKEMLNE